MTAIVYMFIVYTVTDFSTIKGVQYKKGKGFCLESTTMRKQKKFVVNAKSKETTEKKAADVDSFSESGGHHLPLKMR